jgi:hypothetical protein
MAKDKDINTSPSKGISIVIKNDFQPPPIKPKQKRNCKRKVNTDTKINLLFSYFT